MGKTQLKKTGTVRIARGVALTGVVGVMLVALSGCFAVGEPSSSVSVTPVPETSTDTSMGNQNAAFACGEFSALTGVETTMRWSVDQGATTSEAYGQFLERQAFQLSQLYSDDPDLRDAISDVRGAIAQSVATPEGWVYDPTSLEWSEASAAMASACDAAGLPLILKMESGMGG